MTLKPLKVFDLQKMGASVSVRLVDRSDPQRWLEFLQFAGCYGMTPSPPQGSTIIEELHRVDIPGVDTPTSLPELWSWKDILLLLAVAVVALSASSAHAVSPLPILPQVTARSVFKVGSYTSRGYPTRLQVSNNRAYLTVEQGGRSKLPSVEVIDVTNVSSPRLLTSYAMQEPVVWGEVVGDVLYIVRQQDGWILEIVDLQQPTKPAILSQFPLSDLVRLLVEDGIAYLVGPRQLEIIDVRDPRQPVVHGRTTDVSGAYPELEGSYLYVPRVGESIWAPTLTIVDVGNIDQPTRRGFIERSNVTGYFRAVANGTAYFSIAGPGGQARELWVVDVRDPQQPVTTHSLPLEDNTSVSAISDNIAYLMAHGAQGQVRIDLWDLHDPTHPTRVESYDELHSAYGIEVVGNYIFVLHYSGLTILQVRDSFRTYLPMVVR